MFFFDPTYLIFMIPAFILMLLTQGYVSSAYKKWSQVMARSRLTGSQAAQRLISAGGLNVSEGVYNSPSVAALAIAAHELGHAMQDNDGYFPLRLRAAMVPAVNIGSYLGWILIFIGLILRMTNLAWLGVLVFSGGALFALATLPVELNASARAKALLTTTGLIVGDDERRGVNNVLNAAALTYVAGLVTAVMQLLYFISLVGGLGGRRR
jgi:Zn-dependent membrane protease YugP